MSAIVRRFRRLEAAMAVGFGGAPACTSGHLRAVDRAFLQRVADRRVRLSYAVVLRRRWRPRGADTVTFRHVTDIRELLGVESRFAAGAAAARRGRL